ncbi:hypothetical protein PO909_012327, partial [Leuciscus waleckii]
VTAFTTSREFQQQINVSQSASPCDTGGPISELFSNVQCSAEMRHDVHERLTLRFQTGHILSDSHAFVCVCVCVCVTHPVKPTGNTRNQLSDVFTEFSMSDSAVNPSEKTMRHISKNNIIK